MTQTQNHSDLSLKVDAVEVACQLHVVSFTPAGREDGEPRYPACATGIAIPAKGKPKPGSATLTHWWATADTEFTWVMQQLALSGAAAQYTLIHRFDRAAGIADAQWDGVLTVKVFPWEFERDAEAYGPIEVVIQSSVLSRPIAPAAPGKDAKSAR